MIDNGSYNNAPYYYAGGIGGNMPPFYYDLDGNPNNKPHYLRRVQDVKKASTFDVFADNRGAIVTYYNDIDFRHGLKRWILGQNNIGLNTGYANAAYVDGHGGRTRYADIYFWDGVKRGPKYFLFYWDGDVP
jgi:prepilin-type processing-associated H-X9-DG protein